MKQSEENIKKQQVSSLSKDIDKRFEHLANFAADVENQLMLERADRKTIIEKEAEAYRKKIREELEAEMNVKFIERKKALDEKEKALDAKEDVITKREDNYAKTLERTYSGA